MTGPMFILAGEQFFYSHPYWGTLIAGALPPPPPGDPGDPGDSFPRFTPGPDGSSPSRLTPAKRNPAAREPRFPAPPAVAPVFSSVTSVNERAGSHLWIG